MSHCALHTQYTPSLFWFSLKRSLVPVHLNSSIVTFGFLIFSNFLTTNVSYTNRWFLALHNFLCFFFGRASFANKEARVGCMQTILVACPELTGG